MEEKRKKQPPTLRKFMHPRNPYKQPPSFKELSLTFKKFREHCTFNASGKVYFNFKNPDAVATLTKCLLERDYKLKVDIPPWCLVPTLPLRFNYMLWIEDLLGIIYPKSRHLGEKVVGCDIGTGALAIYPLLGVRHFGWPFIASEISHENFQSATENVTQNDLDDKICLHFNQGVKVFEFLEDHQITSFVQNIKSAPRSLGETEKDNRSTVENRLSEYKIDFTMCNPPFFSSEEEMESKRRNPEASAPSAAATGCLQEKIVEGGELLFITKMIEESTKYKHLVRLFSTLIGKQKDVKLVRNILLAEKVAHYKITEFCQGRTMRWGVAWTFDSAVILENYFSKKEKLSAKPLIIYIPRTQLFKYDLNSAWNLVNSWMRELKIKARVFKKDKFCIGAFMKAYKPTWLHQRRKKRQELKNMQQENYKRKAEKCDGDELDCKRLKLDSSDDSIEISSEAAEKSDEHESLEDIAGDPQDAIIAGQSSDPVKTGECKDGLECLLKCNILIVQSLGVLSIELKYLGGKGGIICAHQVVQFLKNKLAKGPHL